MFTIHRVIKAAICAGLFSTLGACASYPPAVSARESIVQITLDRAQKQALLSNANEMLARHEKMNSDEILLDLAKQIDRKTAKLALHNATLAQEFRAEALKSLDGLRGHSAEAIVALERVEVQRSMSSGDIFRLTQGVWGDGDCLKYPEFGVLCLLVTPITVALDVVLMPIELFM